MSRADVACLQCRRRKIACSKKLPHCTECLVHGRHCFYSRDKRRRIDDHAQLPNPSHHAFPQHNSQSEPRALTSSFAHYLEAENTPSRQGSASNSSHANFQSTPNSASILPTFSLLDALSGTIPDAVNDTFWWLASQWQSSLTSDPSTDWPTWTDSFNDSGSARQTLPTSASGNASTLTHVSSGAASIQDPTPASRVQPQNEPPGELYQAYKRCLPGPSRWPKLLKALETLCRTAHGGSETDTSPFLCLSKLQEQLELDTVRAQDALNAAKPNSTAAEILECLGMSAATAATMLPHTSSGSRLSGTGLGQTGFSAFSHPDILRRAWTLAAICLADSICASSPIELPPQLSVDYDHESNATVLLFAVAWDHCRKGLCGDPVEVMQTYRMMALAFSRCHQGQELASASVFLGCRAAATMSIHRAATIASLGTNLRQQQALNAFWHLISQGCHFQAWQGRDMPIDLALVDLPMPDPKVSFRQAADTSPSSHIAAGESPRSQLLSSSPVFMTRICTSVAIGQTIERHYRQGAILLVPCEARLEVAVPMSTKPSHQEQEHVYQTAKALDFCASLLQTREPARTETNESQLTRFVLMLVRYSRVLLHYPFSHVDKDHRKAAQESISAIVSTVLGTLLSLGTEEGGESDDDEDSEGNSSGNGGYADVCGSGSTGNRMSRSSWRSKSALTQPDRARFARVDRHLLELLAGLSIRALVFTLALIQHPITPFTSGSALNDDSERQRSDAVLALGALEQLHQHGVVSLSLLRKARKLARQSGGV